MKTNSHLSSIERDKITVLQGEGLSTRKIAKELGRSPSTISRELNREEAVYFRGKYIGSQTHRNVESGWRSSHKRPNTFLNQKNVKNFIEFLLRYKHYSPAIICNLLKNRFGETVSVETLYIYIYSPKRNLSQYLLRRKYGRKHKQVRFIKQGTGKNIPNRVDIDFREEVANKRLEFGHFEADSVVSCKKRGKQKSCLTVLIDRQSRKTIIRKTASKTSQSTAKSIIHALKPYKNTVKSITYDNGCEFSKHEKINKTLNVKSYFCKPYHSWRKVLWKISMDQLEDSSQKEQTLIQLNTRILKKWKTGLTIAQ